MPRAKSLSPIANRTSELMSDLHLVAVVQCMCESSLFRTRRGKAFERRVVALCVKEKRRLYDAHVRTKAAIAAALGEEG